MNLAQCLVPGTDAISLDLARGAPFAAPAPFPPRVVVHDAGIRTIQREGSDLAWMGETSRTILNALAGRDKALSLDEVATLVPGTGRPRLSGQLLFLKERGLLDRFGTAGRYRYALRARA